MVKKSLKWKIYKLLFLDIYHHKFFNSEVKPQDDYLTEKKFEKYLSDLNLEIIATRNGKEIKFDDDQPVTLFYGDHPSTLDAFFIYYVLRKVDPYFVSYVHNKYHFKFLENRTIPVSEYFASKKINPLGLKLRLATMDNYTQEKANWINSQVCHKAVYQLSKGNSVVIFPSGGWGHWHDGIGFIVSQFHEQFPSRKLMLQPFKEKSFGEVHSVVHSILHTIGIKVPGKAIINFGQEINSTKIYKEKFKDIEGNKKRAKSIRSYLEKKYKSV